MMLISRWVAAFAVAAPLGVAAPSFAADVTDITPDDYFGATYFETALEHPTVAKQKSERKKLAMVARDLRREAPDMGWNSKKLMAAVEKVRGLDGDPLELAKAALMAAFEDSRVKGRVLDVLFNASEPKHVVCYVKWQGSKGKEAVKEASTIANLVAEKAPFVSTLSLAAIHPKAKPESTTSVWQGKIARTAMTRISPARIDSYADRLYKRMFEEVKELPF